MLQGVPFPIAMIKNIDELIAHIPNYTVKTGDEHSAPCPFCAAAEGKHTYVNDQGIPFLGEDRLVKFADKNLFHCRFCKAAGRGRGERFGSYTLKDLAEILGFRVSRDIDAEAIRDERDIKGLDNLIPQYEVDEWHEEVKREYWYQIGIGDEVINRFNLGFAKPLNRVEYGHIIPMRLTNILTGDVLTIGGGIVDELPAYACEYRRIIDGNPNARKTEKPQFLFKGDSKRNGWFWIVVEDPKNTSIIITEGSKDALSAIEIGFSNVVASFGVDHITRKHIQYLKQRGFTKIIIAGDNDEPGQGFSESLFYYCHMENIEAYAVDWDTINIDGNDINDLLVLQDTDAYNTILNNLKTFEITARKLASLDSNTQPKRRLTNFIVDEDDMGILDPLVYTKVWDDTLVTTTLNALRGRDEGSLYYRIKDFVDNYSIYRGDNGAILSVNVPPGTGKTYTSSEIAQELVNIVNEEHLRLVAEIESDIKKFTAKAKEVRITDPERAEEYDTHIGSLRKQIQNLNRIAVAWYGPFKAAFEDIQRFPIVRNEDWFNFEGRHAENCMNYDLVASMGDTRQRIMEYCQKHCRFAKNCAYMKQRKQQSQHPAVYYRHQQLQMEAPSNLKMVIIDESPIHVIEDSVVEIRYPKMKYSAQNGLSKEQNDHITLGVQVIKAVTKNSAKEYENMTLFGKTVLQLLDEEFQLEHQTTLKEWLQGVSEDMLEGCEPNYDDSTATLIPEFRWVESAIRCIIAEYPEYENDENNNSFIHLYNGAFIYMPTDLIKYHFPKSVPIIVLDATGMPALLGAMFNRRVIEFNPVVKNDNLTTRMITGSDYTKTHISGQLRIVRTLELGEALIEDDLSPYEFKKKINDKVPVIRDILDLLRIETRQHDKILFVTYKALSDYLKTQFTEQAENLGVDLSKVTFAHYGSLRGTNRFELYDMAILFGAFRIPYEVVWRKAMMWARLLGSMDAIEFEPVPIKAFYPGTNQGSEIWGFFDAFTQQYLNMIEVGELRQCADRVRPWSGEEKHLMAVMNRPCLPYVNEIITYSAYLTKMKNILFLKEDSLPEWVDEKIYQFIVDEYTATSEYPALSYAQKILNQPDLGRTKFNKVRDFVKEQHLGA